MTCVHRSRPSNIIWQPRHRGEYRGEETCRDEQMAASAASSALAANHSGGMRRIGGRERCGRRSRGGAGIARHIGDGAEVEAKERSIRVINGIGLSVLAEAWQAAPSAIARPGRKTGLA